MAAFAGTTVLFAAASIWTRRTRHGGYERIRLAIMVNPPLGNVCLGVDTCSPDYFVDTKKRLGCNGFGSLLTRRGSGSLSDGTAGRAVSTNSVTAILLTCSSA